MKVYCEDALIISNEIGGLTNVCFIKRNTDDFWGPPDTNFVYNSKGGPNDFILMFSSRPLRGGC